MRDSARLGGLDHPLAAVYDGVSDADPGPLFLALCREQWPAVLDLMAALEASVARARAGTEVKATTDKAAKAEPKPARVKKAVKSTSTAPAKAAPKAPAKKPRAKTG